MCGIIGVAGKIPGERLCTSARDLLAHRGPDGSGAYYDAIEGIALGHRRLSIIDLSDAGKQPMHSHDERFVITFNGEIYNYLELKEELVKSYPFKTKTDTEVLLAAYATWGERCLKRLNGMYAFAIWDRKERVLFCARDRLGIKPLFYHHAPNGTFFFSSEIKGLGALGVHYAQNDGIIYDYLYYGFYDHSSQTFFKNIDCLRPGHFLTWKKGKITIKKYWDLAEMRPPEMSLSETDIRDRFEELLSDAIRLQFRSDVPVGISLTSGMDSNGLLYFAERKTPRVPQMVSACYQSATYDECTLLDASLTASQRTRWHPHYLKPADVFARVQEMMKIEDQPYGGIATTGLLFMYERARAEGITVLLDGDGLDEILAGYKYYELDLARDSGRIPVSGSMSQDTSVFLDHTILSSTFTREYAGRHLDFTTPFNSALQNAQYRDIKHTRLLRDLRFKDHASMHASRELRVPYLDHRLVEFCFFLPLEYKIRNGIHKALARDVLGYYVPEIIRTRPKNTFTAVQVEWLRQNHYRDEIFSLLMSPSFRRRGYFDHRALMAKVDAFYEGVGSNSFFLWQCINLELWFRAFIDSKS
ncbi:MAG: asparagine synthase (glutamine-hydrolysing) [Parcubacteria group bacterium Gr01-1014_48]|nr:MAG: asparagine synthase (glutamine-hydrolysing) [Parcubacteria group bacterium Greene0416_14]TSC74461.1 MAG: asparagine synthase (glutamine-hydrolysing) [Parcubacteria group bacterium Gr01-1014_48]TSD01771.1 MAG: asparagine synthase (glutamine-hydrolysing) [Parcubacteria group bacterium Greene1014_15]TSD08485.1 MAG: asparagine synthase (glutamine-hydrolysing) [Parcubacteria group bacterium Greene0714_4]